MKKMIIKTKRAQKKHRFNVSGILAIVAAFVVIVSCTISDSILSLAQEDNEIQGKFYKSITIEKGDTLWEIAEQYLTDDYTSVQEYVYALKEMNNMNSDLIFAGDKLIVAYNNLL